MSKRTDDTTEGVAGSRGGREGEPGSYYYDDGTGYETYVPEDDADAGDVDEDAPGRDEHPGASGGEDAGA